MMMTPRPTLERLLVGLSLLMGVSGCDIVQPEARQQSASGPTAAPAAACPTSLDAVEARHVVVLLYDRSAAADGQDRHAVGDMRQDLADLVRALPPATHLHGLTAAATQSRVAEVVLREAIPAAPADFECVITNPYDMRQKRRCQALRRQYEAQQQCVAAARQRLITRHLRLVRASGASLEVAGSLAAAAAILSAYPSSTKYLIVYAGFARVSGAAPPRAWSGFQEVMTIVRTRAMLAASPADHPRAAFTAALARVGGRVSVIPTVVPWSTVWPHLGQLDPIAPPLLPLPQTGLAGFMASLEPGPFAVIVASHESKRGAQAESHRIRQRYPALRPRFRRLVGEERAMWAVSIGTTYSYASATALQARAKQLGLRPDTFVWDSR